jgi:predicted Zn-dependent peptidase
VAASPASAVTTLANGIRVVSETVPYANSVAIGVWVDVGARDESEPLSGISHFLEHLLFKGTARRTARAIAEELDFVGGQLNAFTDKEHTCYYAKVLPEHVPVALDVLGDMLQHSLLDPEELEREKNVIIEEIKQHEDTPEELVHDVFVTALWPDHPLGRPVIGRAEVIEALSRHQVVDYLRRHYVPARTLIAAAGNLCHADLVTLVEQCFDGARGSDPAREAGILATTAAAISLARPVEQVHFCLGTRGCSQIDPDRYALGVIDSAVGGGMSSRLFQEVREKRGLCYSIGSYTASYREGGLFAVYAGTSLENLEEVQALSRTELAAVAADGLGDEELERAKNQIRGAILLGLDSMSGRMTRLAKSLLYYDRVVPAAEVVDRIQQVTSEDVRRVAAALFSGGEYAIAAIGPFDDSDVEE